MPKIVMRFGATANSINVDGLVIDRNTLPKGEDRKMRGIVVGALKKDGYFARKDAA